MNEWLGKHIIVERMHKSSSLVLILSIFLIHYQNVKCGSKSDDQWWNHLGLETNQKSQWTTIDNKDIPDNTAQSSNRSVKRSSAAFNDNNTDSPVRTRSRNWEKSFARKRDFDRTWSDGQPIRERFRETEWDDDVPVRHVFKDSTSAVDEGNTRIRMGDDVKIERMSRVWTGDDGDDDDDRGTSFVRSSNSGRNSNNSNNRSNTNANNKPKAVTNTYGSTATQQQSPKSDRTDRVLSLNFQDPDSKKKDRERLDRLAKQIFNMDDDNTGTTVRSNGFTGTTAKSNGFTGTTVRNNGFTTTPARSNGNSGNGYVSNAVNSFTRGSGNTYVSNNANNGYMRNSGNEFTNNKNNDKTNTNKLGADSVKPTKPKMIVMFETTPKPVPSNTAKSTANDVRNVAEKPKSTTTPIAPSAQLKSQFGWRSSISHNKDQKLQTQNQKLQESNEETDNFEDIEEDIDDTTTARPTRVPVTRPPVVIRTTVRPTTTRATFRPTIRPTVEYTTYRMTDTTRPQTTTSITNKPNNRETTVLTTTRPKLSQPNAVTNSLAPNKKQHRMGSWVDSDSMDYELGDNAADCGTNCPIGDNEAISDWAEEPIDDRSQPIVESEEFGNEQLPERVEDAAVPEVESPKFARQRQSAPAGGEREDQSGWTLEDALPGVPGTDYPTFATIPKTAFDCKTHQWPGYYADVETQCQVFHICQTGGRKNSFLCPNGTMFNQQVFVCDWWHNVQCGDSVTHYPLNENIYDHNWESKRVTKTETEGSVRRSGSLMETAEPLTDEMAVTTAPIESELSDTNGSVENKDVSDAVNEGSNDFGANEEDTDEETGRASRVRSPVRIYRTSRFMTPLDRQKRRRRKRGYLKA